MENSVTASKTGIIAAITLGLMLFAAQGALAVNGVQSAKADPFGLGIVQVSVYSVALHEQWVCTGTLVASTWVLTSAGCAGPAGSTTIWMDGGAAAQTSGVREVVAHPSLDLALLLLSTPMTTANRSFPQVSSIRPLNGTVVYCIGFGGGNYSVLHKAPFGVAGGGNNFTLDSTNKLEDGDEGGPCYDTTISTLVGVISAPQANQPTVTSGVGLIGTGASGEAEADSVQQWIADMIHLDGLKWGHYSYTIINKHSAKAFDVANASLLPGTAVNQNRLNGGLNQNWYWEYANYPLMRMVNAQSGKCLDVDTKYQLRQSTCGPATSQLFRISWVDNIYAKVVSYSGFVVDVPWASTDDGIRLQVYSSNGGDNQLWYFGIR
jgi:hypothetical protein